MVTGKFAVYLMSLMVTLIASSVCDSHSDSDKVLDYYYDNQSYGGLLCFQFLILYLYVNEIGQLLH